MRFVLTGLLIAVAFMFLAHETLLAMDKSHQNEINKIERHIELTDSTSVKGDLYE